MKKPKYLFGLFAIDRTSCWDEKPCYEAVEVAYIRVDRRTTDDPAKNPHIGKTWYDFGENHRIEDGMIARDFRDKRWMVSIESPDSLKAFIDKYGDVIISVDHNGKEPCYKIEIYDDYRE
jgi:hypothetical protein